MTGVYLGLGTNLGDRAANLAEARRRLADAVRLDRISRVYESEPVGLSEQPLFLNQVVGGRTALFPFELLTLLKRLEVEMGRVPSVRNGPRLIDLDILFYGNWICGADGLILPHPRLRERSFVLAPLAEIAPDFPDPLTGETVGAIWAREAGNLSRSWVYHG